VRGDLCTAILLHVVVNALERKGHVRARRAGVSAGEREHGAGTGGTTSVRRYGQVQARRESVSEHEDGAHAGKCEHGRRRSGLVVGRAWAVVGGRG